MLGRVPPWVIVAGGFHQQGGMDKANAALADSLLRERVPLHLVAHRVDSKYLSDPLATVHLVGRPAGWDFLGERNLSRRGRAVARAVTAKHEGARVVVNGGNCVWPDVNWVHSVHHAWPCVDDGAPFWFRAKNRFVKAIARRDERRAISSASLTVTNSERTRRDVIATLGVDSSRVHTVYLGSDASWDVPPPIEQRAARKWLEIPDGRPLVAFVGALSHDDNKGLGTLCRAWAALCGDAGWDADLVVAGGGNGLSAWRDWVARAGLSERVRLLGHTNRVFSLLAAADLLVSPVRYEAYGLNVQEALCRGVPALVSATAGVAERYPSESRMMLISDPRSVDELIRKLVLWRQNMAAWKAVVRPIGEQLRRYSWNDMARRIVEVSVGHQSRPFQTSTSPVPIAACTETIR